MPQHQDALQLRAAGHPRRGAGGRAAVRTKAQRDRQPSAANEHAFGHAVEDITEIAERLLAQLVTTAPPKDREVEAAKAKERSLARFGS